MEAKEYFDALGKPFESDSIKWRIQYMTKEKTKGFAVPYADSRAIADRLDEVVGQLNWQDSYTAWHNISETDKNNVTTITASQLCTISIYYKEMNAWISKTDGASNSDIEPVKGGLSDAFKRAATKWNIGRYLYKFDGKWVEIEERGKSYAIKETEKDKLAMYYNETIAKLFQNNSPAPAPVSNIKNAGKTEPNAAEVKETADASVSSKQNQHLYEVLSIDVNNNGNGTSSRLKLKQGDKVITAFLNGENDRIMKGTNLKSLKLQEKEASFGKYHIIEQYDIAA